MPLADSALEQTFPFLGRKHKLEALCGAKIPQKIWSRTTQAAILSTHPGFGPCMSSAWPHPVMLKYTEATPLKGIMILFVEDIKGPKFEG